LTLLPHADIYDAILRADDAAAATFSPFSPRLLLIIFCRHTPAPAAIADVVISSACHAIHAALLYD